MKKQILIIGSGIAGLSCANLLLRNGWKVILQDFSSPSSKHIIVINNITRELLENVWKNSIDILKGLHETEFRKTCWTTEEAVSTLTQQSIVTRSHILKVHLTESLVKEYPDDLTILHKDPSEANYDNSVNWSDRDLKSFSWIIDSSGRNSQISRILDSSVNHLSFGRRFMVTSKAALRGSEKNTIWMEAISEGWVFLAPLDGDFAVIQAMFPTEPKEPLKDLNELITRTGIIKRLIDNETLKYCHTFRAYPQISYPFCGMTHLGIGWISIGDAAVSFDPLSGDGIGYSLRGAILASAVINAIYSGFSLNDCLSHYSIKICNALNFHLTECIRYYSSSDFSTPDWKEEIKLMMNIPHTLKYKIPIMFGLQGFELVKLGGNN